MEAFLKGSSSTGAASAQQSAAKKKKRAERVLPWVEKYRPKTVQEISYQDEIVAVLSKILEGADLPNLLFYGPPGTGKTSAMLAAARQMFGSDLYRDRVLELNASDERGIQVVREKIKRFAQFSASGVRPNGTSCPPLKIIILDEADAMTTAAQAALRRTMEREAKTTRFCLICNYISRIIDPLTSRCAKFRFKPLSEEIQLKRLMFVCDQENLKISQSALKSLIGACEGDLRKSMTFLQSASSFKSGQEINDEDVAEITGVVSTPVLMGFLNVAKSGSFERLQLCIKNLILDGYPAYQLLTQLFDLIMEQADLPDKQKAAVCEKMAVCDKRLLDGADEFVQLLDLGCTLLMQYKSI